VRVDWEQAILGLIGIVLLAWGVISPVLVPYLIGSVLVALAVLWVLVQHRPHDQQHPGNIRPLARVLIPIAVFAVVLSAPLGLRALQSSSDVLWRSELPPGQATRAGEHLYLDSITGPLDLHDGSATGRTAGDTVMFHDGSAASVTGADMDRDSEPTVSYFDAAGEEQWQTTITAEDWETVRVHAERQGHVVISRCGYDEPDQLAQSCRITGLDTSGEEAWHEKTHIVDHTVSFNSVDNAVNGGMSLPPTAPVLKFPQESKSGGYHVSILDPVSGETVATVAAGAHDAEGVGTLTEFRVFGSQLLAVGVDEAGCFAEAYDLAEGGRLWHTADFCPQKTRGAQPHFLRPEIPDSQYAYVWEDRGRSDDALVRDSGPPSLFSVSLTDGSVHRVDLAQIGDPETRVDAADLFLSLDVWSTATAGELLLSWDGTDIAASDAADGRQRWQVEIPGSKIRAFDAAHGTLAVVTESPGHNPYVPWPGDARGEPVRVTVVDAEDGEIISSTLFPDGAEQVTVAAPGQVLVQELPAGQAALVGRS